MTFKTTYKYRFLRASSIVMIGAFLVNILNYLFNVVTGRMLEPSQFGEVASLMGLFAIVTVPSAALTMTLAGYISGRKTKSEAGLMIYVYRLFSRYSFFIGMGLLGVFLLIVPWLQSFLLIDRLPFLIFGLMLPISLINAVSQGMLQGQQKFIPFSIMRFLSAAVKLLLAICFIFLGFSVPGVIAAVVIGTAISFTYGYFSIRPQVKDPIESEKEKERLKKTQKNFFSYINTVFWTSLLLVLFINIDVVLAKHYFDPDMAGQYAILSLTGKIIVYGAGAFITTMFPMISAAKAHGEQKEKKLLTLSFLVVTGISCLLLLFFVPFPDLAIRMLFGAKYISIAPYLGWFSLAMMLGALSQVLLHYFMAIQSKKYLLPFVFSICLQIFLIACFHETIWQITMDILIASFTMLVGMALVFFRYEYK